MMAVSTPNWKKVDENNARLVFEQAEKRLNAQLSVALAADARALNILALFFGVASALAAFSFSQFVSAGFGPLQNAAFSGSLVLYVACALLTYSARPVDFYVSGNEPHNYYECLDEPIAELMGVESENYDEIIAANETTIAGNEKALRHGLAMALSAPLISLTIFLISLSAMTS